MVLGRIPLRTLVGTKIIETLNPYRWEVATKSHLELVFATLEVREQTCMKTHLPDGQNT